MIAVPTYPALDICRTNALGFVECPTNTSKLTGNVLIAQTYDFSPAVTEPFWALGFSSLGNQYPYAVNIQQAFFYNNLQVYPSDLPQLNATTVQFGDSYKTPSGIVQTKWTIKFDHVAKTITVGNLMTKLPQSSSYRACSEILLSFWKANVFNYSVSPETILLPYE